MKTHHLTVSSLFSTVRQMLPLAQSIALCQWVYISIWDYLSRETISLNYCKSPLKNTVVPSSKHYFQTLHLEHTVVERPTFRADLADFLHVVLGAVVDGMRDSALADGLVLAGRRGAEHSHVLHRLAELGGCDTNTT